jgi:predicted dehydrogenase
MHRRTFIRQTGSLALGTGFLRNGMASLPTPQRIALVGTGIRGVDMWGRQVVDKFKDRVRFVGLCDINPGRVEMAKAYLGVDCPTFTDFERMMRETKPDTLIVTTVDATHHEFIIKGMRMGADIITEKPLTTDESKCQQILDAQKKTGRNIRVTFNYRYSPHRVKIYELLNEGKIGNLTSVDFHWYLDIHHGADYFRRWHRLRSKSGSLLVHKASHHFDLLNWWIDSDPEEVFAYGALEHYGRNGPFRHTHCRTCPHKKDCAFHFDITKQRELMMLYVQNEGHDGYLRDGCVFREDIDIFDKMAVQIRYANKVQVSYSLTAYSPYEGYRISFNGTKGKIDAWIKEMQPWEEEAYDEIQLTTNFGKRELFRIPHSDGGHGGGDDRLHNQIFLPGQDDPYRQAAGLRDGAMAVLIGVAAKNSIDTGKPVRIESLTSLKPGQKRV